MMRSETLGDITLYNADCMELLREMPDNAYDLAIVGPPYGDANFQTPPHQAMSPDGGGGSTNTKGRWNRFGQRFDRYKKTEQTPCAYGEIREISTLYPPPIQPNESQVVSRTGGTWAQKYDKKIIGWDIAPSEDYFKELFRVSRNQIIWGANYFPNMPPTRCFIVWRKLSISENFSMAMAEYAWTSFNRNAKVFECAPQGKKSDPRFHPTAKPIELYKWILVNFAKEGDTILDTHLGSGSIAIACHELGFNLTGIEIDEEYYDKSLERIKRYQKQMTLF